MKQPAGYSLPRFRGPEWPGEVSGLSIAEAVEGPTDEGDDGPDDAADKGSGESHDKDHLDVGNDVGKSRMQVSLLVPIPH